MSTTWEQLLLDGLRSGFPSDELLQHMDDILAWFSRLEDGDGPLESELVSEFGDLDTVRRNVVVMLDRLLFTSPSSDRTLFGRAALRDREELKRRYGRLMRVFHPDRGYHEASWLTARSEIINTRYKALQKTVSTADPVYSNGDQREASIGAAVSPKPRPAPAEKSDAQLAFLAALRRHLPESSQKLQQMVVGGLVVFSVLLVTLVYQRNKSFDYQGSGIGGSAREVVQGRTVNGAKDATERESIPPSSGDDTSSAEGTRSSAEQGNGEEGIVVGDQGSGIGDQKSVAEIAGIGEEQEVDAEAVSIEAERIAAAQLEAERAAAEQVEAARLEAERIAAAEAEAMRLEAERVAAAQAAEDAARIEAERLADAEAAKVEAERSAALAEAELVAAEQLKAEEAARLEQQRIAAEQAEAARLEAERVAAIEEAARIEAARVEAERVAALAAAERAAAEQEKVDELARLEAERLAEERAEAASLEAERLAAAESEAARLEAERIAAEEAARIENARIAAEAEALRQQRELMRFEVMTLMERMRKAYDAGDADAYASFFAPDGSDSDMQGRGEIQRRYQGFFGDTESRSWRAEIHNIVLREDGVIEVTGLLSVQLQQGRRKQFNGRYDFTLTAEKGADTMQVRRFEYVEQ